MKIELCTSSLESLEYAKKYSFDRVELCQCLEQGGLTPSLSFQKIALSYAEYFETHVLFRNRAGGFVYTELEKEMLLQEMDFSHELGIHGFVVGALTKKKKLDLVFLEKIRHKFPEKELTCHRAFDDLEEIEPAIKQLTDLGFKRILTSGRSSSAKIGIETLTRIKEVSEGKIEIMIGGGINAENVAFLQTKIQPDAIHFSGTIFQEVDSNSIFCQKLLISSEEKIKSILEKINR
jgi:copper homeostasis protein